MCESPELFKKSKGGVGEIMCATLVPSLPVSASMNRAAMWASALGVCGVVKRGKGFGQVFHDALQLQLASGHQMAAVGAIPLEGI
jgi:hypothetical protein